MHTYFDIRVLPGQNYSLPLAVSSVAQALHAILANSKEKAALAFPRYSLNETPTLGDVIRVFSETREGGEKICDGLDLFDELDGIAIPGRTREIAEWDGQCAAYVRVRVPGVTTHRCATDERVDAHIRRRQARLALASELPYLSLFSKSTAAGVQPRCFRLYIEQRVVPASLGFPRSTYGLSSPSAITALPHFK